MGCTPIVTPTRYRFACDMRPSSDPDLSCDSVVEHGSPLLPAGWSDMRGGHHACPKCTPAVDRTCTTLTDGGKVTPDHREIDPATGQQKGYVVLCEDERAKGFVRPVRRSYRHVGPAGPAHPLRDATDDERRRAGHDYVKFEAYQSESPITGRFWTQAQLDSVGKGCGTVTTMSVVLAETYARDPGFYGGTFCAGCRMHLPVGANGEFVWEGTTERVGT